MSKNKLENKLEIKSNEIELFSGFLWSPIEDKWKNIIDELNMYNNLIKYSIFEFNNYDIFQKIILDIYKIDDIELEKVKNVKLENMKKYNYKFIYFELNIRQPNYRIKEKTGNPISTTVEKVKLYIRNKYKNSIKNYVYDIIIHLADNIDQSNQIKIIINKLNLYKISEFVNLKYFLKKNFKNNVFNRCDMIIRKYSISEYLKNKNYDFAFYTKMQSIRLKTKIDNYTQNFKNLIESFLKNGYKTEYPLLYHEDYQLFNGCHRLAYLYLKNIKMISVQKIEPNNSVNIVYNINWFVNNNFDEDCINMINNDLQKLDTFLNN
jgi:hypothetical protein